MKKVELHVHLEGTITPEMARQLAKRNKMKLPPGLLTHSGYRWEDFEQFLNTYDTVCQFLRSPRDYYDISFDYLSRLASQECIYVELMYSPAHAEQTIPHDREETLAAIIQAIDDAEKQFGIVSRIIITGVRHFGVENVTKVAEEACGQHPYVTGFGLGGDEKNYPASLFDKAYAIANEAGLQGTVHVGEFTGCEYIEQAIQSLPVQRLGHGVRAIESQHTLSLIKDRGISLELCPSSNIATGIYPALEQHPVRRLFEAGISISLNSDDPPYFNTSLQREYDLAHQFHRFTHDELNTINTMALEAAFVDETYKKSLLQRLSANP